MSHTAIGPSGTPPPPGRPYPPPGRVEAVWPAQAAVLAAIALQLLLPERLTAGPTWLLPALEGALLVGLSLATPRQLEREHSLRRGLALGMTAFVSVANIISLALLVHFLLHHATKNGQELIVAGALIWLTNVLSSASGTGRPIAADRASAPPVVTNGLISCFRR